MRIAVTLFGLLLLPGCSHWPLQEPQPFPSGIYTFSLSAAEIPPEVPPDILPNMVGTFVVTFSPQGRVKNEVNGKLDAEGHYASTSHYLVITDEAGPGHCEKEHATGIYRWELIGNQLRLSSVEDRCRWREFSIVRKPWTRISAP